MQGRFAQPMKAVKRGQVVGCGHLFLLSQPLSDVVCHGPPHHSEHVVGIYLLVASLSDKRNPLLCLGLVQRFHVTQRFLVEQTCMPHVLVAVPFPYAVVGTFCLPLACIGKVGRDCQQMGHGGLIDGSRRGAGLPADGCTQRVHIVEEAVGRDVLGALEVLQHTHQRRCLALSPY